MAPSDGDCAFLVGRLIDPATLERAERLAVAWQAPTHQLLIAMGWVSEADYVRILAERLGAVLLTGAELKALMAAAAPSPVRGVFTCRLAGLPPFALIDATAYAPPEVRRLVSEFKGQGWQPVLARPSEIEELPLDAAKSDLIARAVDGLRQRAPVLSAGHELALWQRRWIVSLALLVIGALAMAPEGTVRVLCALLTVPFLCVAALRCAAAVEILRRPRRGGDELRGPAERDPDLPFYSVLVPLHREASVLAALVASLRELDYPAVRLEVLLILESGDEETRHAAETLDLPGNFRILVVPEGGPRTKPKALNYALQVARGDYIVVYDAEDRPEPDQLRRALAAFRASGPEVACVQARLGIYNARQSWLTRQFALEYCALFDAILPALERLSLPVPLGGTSNHFRSPLLRKVGAWDPFNVTEDADLGIRLARAGYQTVTLASTTWEEAPPRLGNWMRQRTRWLKGWTQTYLVHTREPRRLLRQLGLARCLGFHVLMGGMLLSVLVHPLAYAVLAVEAWNGRLLAESAPGPEQWMWRIAILNLALGYAASMIVGALAAARRGWPRLAIGALGMPFYWLLISIAGYRALIQLVRQPYLWEKTEHGPAAGVRNGAAPAPRGRIA